MQVSEIVGMEGDIITMQDIFVYEREGIAENDRVLGHFKATGIRPRFSDRLKSYGIDLSAAMFSNPSQPRTMHAEEYRDGRTSCQCPGARPDRVPDRGTRYNLPGLSLGVDSGKSAEARYDGSPALPRQRAAGRSGTEP